MGYLTDLIADWELTSNANDSVGSSNFAEAGTGAALTYDAAGVHFPGDFPASRWLQIATPTAIALTAGDWELQFFYKVPSADTNSTNTFFSLGDFNNFPTLLINEANVENISAQLYDGTAIKSVATANGAAARGTEHFVDLWYTASDHTLHLEIDRSGSVATVVCNPLTASVGPLIAGDDGFQDGCDGTLRLARWWIGASAIRTDAERTWLYNSGTGRTYAELVAADTPATAASYFRGRRR